MSRLPSEVSHFIPEPRNFSEVTKLSENIKKPWLKATLYKAKIQSDGSLDKLKLRVVVRGDLHNKEMVRGTWSPTVSMRTFKYFLADAAKHKSRVHQLDFIGAFFQAKVKNRVFVKLDIRYTDYFQNMKINLEEP